ncbi:hypothetical protein EV714DRAFT_274318 [Schizophyllum commune]
MAGYVKTLTAISGPIADAHPIASAVVFCLEKGVKEFDKRLQCSEDVLQLINDIADASKRISEWHDNPRFNYMRPTQQRTVQVLLQEVYEILSYLRPLSNASALRRSSTQVAHRVQELRGRIKAFMQQFQDSGHVDTQLAVFTILEEARLEHLPYARGVDASSSKLCLPGTRVALLQDIEDWARSPDSPRAYILYGSAGKGKSAIAHTTARQLAGLGFITPFFAFDRSDRTRAAHQLLPTIAKSLAEQNKLYSQYLCSMRSSQLSTRDLQDQSSYLITETLGDCTVGPPIVFVIDALDECPVDSPAAAIERRKLLHTLRRCLDHARLPTNVRFFLTYRQEEDVHHVLGQRRIPAIRRCIDEVEGAGEDLRKLVAAALSDIIGGGQINDIAEVAQDLFECAAILCRELSTYNSTAMAIPRAIKESCRDDPGNVLCHTYYAIMETHFDPRDSVSMAAYRKVLSWIFAVQSPQPYVVFRNFEKVLLPHQSDLSRVLGGLKSLLTGVLVDNSATPITAHHTSFRDFLLDAGASGPFCIASELDIADEELAYACFRIANDPVRGLRYNICQLPTSMTFKKDIKDLSERVNKHVSPSLQYACLATSAHLLQGVAGARASEIRGEAKVFMEKNFLFWLEACGWLDSAPTAASQQFVQWSKASGATELEPLMADCAQFEGEFRDAIMASPLQVYISGLLLSPNVSLARQLHRAHFAFPIDIPGYVVFDTQTGQQVGSALSGHEGAILCVAFTGDGKRISSGSEDKTARIWDAETGCQVEGLAPLRHSGAVRSVAFSPDGARIATGSDDKSVRLWDSASGREVGPVLLGHHNRIHSVAFSPDGARVVSSSWDKTVRIWDITPLPADDASTLIRLDKIRVEDGWLLYDHDGTARPILWIPPYLRHYPLAFSPFHSQFLPAGQHIRVRFNNPMRIDQSIITYATPV